MKKAKKTKETDTLKYNRLPYRTSDDQKKAHAYIAKLQSKHNHVMVIDAGSYTLLVEYK